MWVLILRYPTSKGASIKVATHAMDMGSDMSTFLKYEYEDEYYRTQTLPIVISDQKKTLFQEAIRALLCQSQPRTLVPLLDVFAEQAGLKCNFKNTCWD